MAKYESHIEAFWYAELLQELGDREEVEFRGVSLKKGYGDIISLSCKNGEYNTIRPGACLVFPSNGFWGVVHGDFLHQLWTPVIPQVETPIFPPEVVLGEALAKVKELTFGQQRFLVDAARYIRGRFTDDDLRYALDQVRDGKTFGQENWEPEFLIGTFSVALYGVELQTLLEALCADFRTGVIPEVPPVTEKTREVFLAATPYVVLALAPSFGKGELMDLEARGYVQRWRDAVLAAKVM